MNPRRAFRSQTKGDRKRHEKTLAARSVPGKDMPILFISHSTHGPTASNRTRKVLQHLQTLLAAKWHVFVDGTRIKPGDPWRTSVLHHLEMAQAAIILFDEAAVKSKWVEAEALIFSFRRSMDSSFPLLPVLFDGLKPEDYCFRKYEPFQLNEVQATKDDRPETPKQLAERIASDLKDPGTTTTNRWVDAVCGLMGGIEWDPLRFAAQALQCMEDISTLHWSAEERLKARYNKFRAHGHFVEKSVAGGDMQGMGSVGE